MLMLAEKNKQEWVEVPRRKLFHFQSVQGGGKLNKTTNIYLKDTFWLEKSTMK